MILAETLASAELRTRLALRQIDEIRRGEHTHNHPPVILAEIAELIDENHKELERAVLTGNADIIRNRAADLITELDTYLPLLGFILRSSNVRNAFEVFDPLIAICSAVLGEDVRLIYSSEWDYSPFTETFTFPKLQNELVVVGLPAHESSNSLVIPVVGHELGHALWYRADVISQLGPGIEGDVIAYFIRHLDEVVEKEEADDIRSQAAPEIAVAVFVPEVGRAQSYAKLQCEEVFCDIAGIRLFGASYLRAFAYLVFPSPKGFERHAFEYPNYQTRVRYMISAAKYFGSVVSPTFGDDYDDVLSKSLVGSRRHMVLAADEATEHTFDKLLAEVDRLFPVAIAPKIDENKVAELIAAFSLNRPGDDFYNLPDIIEAAWRRYSNVLNESQTVNFAFVNGLNELVFKTIEVTEFYRRTGR